MDALLSPRFRSFNWLRGKSSQFIHFLRIIFDFIHFMVISLVNFSQRNVVDGLLVSWVSIVREALNFTIKIASLLLVAVRWEDLSESISHLHFPIKSSCHVAVWGESSSFLLKPGYWRFCVMISVVRRMSLPFFLNCRNKLWPLYGPFSLIESFRI